VRFEPASGRTVVQGAVITIDEASGRASAITRIQEYVERP
jgi:calcineurin-like phosphoesterase